MSKELYINGILIDLDPNVSIGVTFQVNDIAELKDRKANHTNQFSIPATAHNINALGYSNAVNSTSRLPYRKLPAKYIDDGIEIVSSGIAVIESATEKFSVIIYSGNYDFFAKLEGKLLTDIILSDLDHTWNLSDIFASRAFSEAQGYCYPIIDYTGSDTWFNHGVAGGIRLEKLYPAMFVKKIIERLSIDAAYLAEGSFLEDDVCKRLILPFANDYPRHSQLWIEERSAIAVSTSTQVFSGIVHQPIQFENETLDVSNFGSDVPAAGYQYAPTGIVNEMNCFVKLTLNIEVPNPGVYQVFIERFHAVFLTWQPWLTWEFPNSGTYTRVFDIREYGETPGPVHLRAGEKIRASFFVASGGPMTILPGSTIELIPDEYTYFGSSIQLGRCLPNMKQKDFIKSLCNQFCLIPVTDDQAKTIKLNKFSDIYKNKSQARDWSGKIDQQSAIQISFRFGRLGQKNHLKYLTDENVTEGLGDGYFVIDDEVLEKEVIVDTLSFAATEMRVSIPPLLIPFIKIWNETGALPPDPSGDIVPVIPRILLHHFYPDPDGYIYYVNEAGGILLQPFEVPMAWFISPDGALPSRPIDTNLGFDDTLIEEYYSPITTMTDRFKKVTAFFKLSSVDVQNFDHMIPVWIEQFNEYFFVNKISNYKPDQLTQVELYRL